jgi:hypothetical protein
MCDVASCWIYEYIRILLGARPILQISRIKVNLLGAHPILHIIRIKVKNVSVTKFALYSGKGYETLLGLLVAAAAYPLPSVIRTAWILCLIPIRGLDYFL